MTALLLHLSDIHIKGDSDPILSRAAFIASCSFNALPEASILFVVISGDIAFSGKAEQYSCANSFLAAIKAAIQIENNIPVHFVVAPGNHDCNFERDNNMRKLAIKCLNDGSTSVDESVIGQCTAIQDEFFSFKDDLILTAAATNDRLWQTYTFEVGEKKIIFDVLNVSWVSRIHEEQGGLVFPYERYATKNEENADARIVIMHHPLNWFNQGTYRPFRKFVRKLANIVITGHEHQANIGENFDSESSLSAYIEGGVLQETSGIENSAFNLVELDLDDGLYKSTRFAWKGKYFEATEEGSWADYRELPGKQHNTFEIQKEFRQLLDDLGASLGNPGRPKVSLN